MAPTFERTLVIGEGITKWITRYQSSVESLFNTTGSVVTANEIIHINKACRSGVLP